MDNFTFYPDNHGYEETGFKPSTMERRKLDANRAPWRGGDWVQTEHHGEEENSILFGT
jgi:hypothetical protein